MLAGPTYVSLLRIRQHPTVADALAAVAERPNEVFLPRLVKQGDLMFSVYQTDPAYQSGDLDAPGPRHRMQMLAAGYHYINDADPV